MTTERKTRLLYHAASIAADVAHASLSSSSSWSSSSSSQIVVIAKKKKRKDEDDDGNDGGGGGNVHDHGDEYDHVGVDDNVVVVAGEEADSICLAAYRDLGRGE